MMTVDKSICERMYVYNGLWQFGFGQMSFHFQNSHWTSLRQTEITKCFTGFEINNANDIKLHSKLTQ